MDNNAVERAMKPITIGRTAWLRDVLRKLPAGDLPETLLPDVWMQHNPQHCWTIAEWRKQERIAKLQDL